MSRELGPERDPDDDREPEPAGHVRSTSPGTIVGFALTGLVLGWLLRPVSIRLTDSAPMVGWLPVLALFFVAVIMGSVAWLTHRALHGRREQLEPHRAVNRLVLGKACAVAGSLVGGGYFGYALSYLGIAESALAQQRVLQALLAGVACVAWVTGSLLLERACRINREDDRDLR